MGAALLAGVAGLGAVLGVVVGAPTSARASTADVDQGSPITRQTMVERALSWTDEAVPYSQSSYWPASAPRTGAGHAYRQDCSGFVSMAWDLPGSAVTGDFVSSSSPYDTRLASWDQLQPGDLLGVSGHVVLFLGWSDTDAGAHRWFDMVSEATTGTNASVQRGQDRQGYWSSYLPYRYKGALDDAPQSVSWGGGRVDQFRIDAAGHVQHRWSVAAADGSSTWATQDLTATYGLATLRTGLAATSTGSGVLEVFGAGRDGRLVSWLLTGSTWTQTEYASPAPVLGFAAAAAPTPPGGTPSVQLVARQHAANDVDGSLVTATWTPTSFSGWSAVPGAPAVVDDPAAVRTRDGRLLVAVEGTSGALSLGTLSGSWTWSVPFGGTRVAARPALAALADGTLVLAAVGGGALQTDTLAPGATAWSGFTTVTGVPTLISGPGWASSSALPSASAAAPLDVYAESTVGSIVAAERSAGGSWAYVGGAAPRAVADDATAHTGSRTLHRS